MAASLFRFRVAAFVLGSDVCHVVGDLRQFVAAIIRLDDDALPCLGDVMLEAHHFLEAERLAEFSGQFHRLVVDRVRPVESDQRTCAVFAAEEFCHRHDPQRVVGIVRAEEHGDLELDVYAQAIEQEAEQDGSGVEVEHMLNAVVGVVIQELVEPLQGVIVGLADAAEIARDGGRPAQVRIGAVRAFGIERLNEDAPMISSAATMVGRSPSASDSFMFLTAMNRPGTSVLSVMAFSAIGRSRREVLQGGDFERYRIFILELHLVRSVA